MIPWANLECTLWDSNTIVLTMDYISKHEKFWCYDLFAYKNNFWICSNSKNYTNKSFTSFFHFVIWVWIVIVLNSLAQIIPPLWPSDRGNYRYEPSSHLLPVLFNWKHINSHLLINTTKKKNVVDKNQFIRVKPACKGVKRLLYFP